MNIYVSNLSFDVQDEDLKDFFAPYGEVTDQIEKLGDLGESS